MRFRFLCYSFRRLRPLHRNLESPSSPTSPLLDLLPRARVSRYPWNFYLGQDSRVFSSGDNGSWKFGGDDGFEDESLFGKMDSKSDVRGDSLQGVDEELESKSDFVGEWKTAVGYKPWGFDGEESKGELFDFGEERGDFEGFIAGDEKETEENSSDQLKQLEKEEQELRVALKGLTRNDLLEVENFEFRNQ